jgi:hypothetical protein
MIVPPIPPEKFPKPFTPEERAKLVHKIWQQRRQLRGLNKTIKLYRLMWLEGFDRVRRERERGDRLAESLLIQAEAPPHPDCWWCRVKARGERWWQA